MTELHFPSTREPYEGWEWEHPPGRWQRKSAGEAPTGAHFANFADNLYSDGYSDAAAWFTHFGVTPHRPTAKWVRNQAGNMVEVAAGVPAIWHGQGLLLEPASENTTSNDDGFWSYNQTGTGASFPLSLPLQATSPTGVINTACVMAPTVGNNHHTWMRTGGAVSGRAVVSMYLKAEGILRWVFIAFPASVLTGTTLPTDSPTAWTVFDLQGNGGMTGGQINNAVHQGGGIEPIGGGWYHCWQNRGTNVVNNTYCVGPSPASTINASSVNALMHVNFSGLNTTDRILMWGLQNEAEAVVGRSATSLMRRGIVGNSRQADTLDMTAALASAQNVRVNGVSWDKVNTQPPFNMITGLPANDFLESVEWD
jgi:hypothetical protein